MNPTRPCPFCTCAKYLNVPNVSVEVATPLPTPDRFRGAALICSGCGHVDYFIDDIANWTEFFADPTGATVVTVPKDAPYR